MKIEEAKTKICPFMGCVEKFGSPEGGHCMADRCMAWEFELIHIDYTVNKDGVEVRSETDGYCKRLYDSFDA